MDDIITIEECITRLDAIRHEIVSNSRDHFALSAGIAALYEMEKGAPAVNRWISVEDSLPDSKEDVLVWFEYFRYGEYNCLYQTYGIGNYNKNYDGWMVNHETGWDQLRVIAWMPMPDAYKPPEKE